MSWTFLHFRTSLMIGHSQSMAMSRKSSQRTVRSHLERHVPFSHYIDANLYHDMLSGHSVTRILHLINKCPIDWYFKKQGTVETVTFGSEANAARTAMEPIIDLCGTLHYIGVPLRDSSYMFGDNKTVVDSGSLPHAKLHKRHTMLSYHHVHEAIANGMVKFFHIPGEINPADILCKHWGHQQIWKQLQPLLFWKGDTRSCLKRSIARKSTTASLNERHCPQKWWLLSRSWGPSSMKP